MRIRDINVKGTDERKMNIRDINSQETSIKEVNVEEMDVKKVYSDNIETMAEEGSIEQGLIKEKTAEEKPTEERVTKEKPAEEKPTEERTTKEKSVEEKPTEKITNRKFMREVVTEEPTIQKKETEEEVVETAENVDSKKSFKKKIGLIGAAATFVLILAFIYFGGAFYYMSHFFPETFLDGFEVSNMNSGEVVKLLSNKVESYSLAIIGRDSNSSNEVIGTISADEIDLVNAVTENDINVMIGDQNCWVWPVEITRHNTHEMSYSGVTFDERKLENVLKSFPAFNVKNMIKPQNAYISGYSEEINGYEIIQETLGNEIDMSKLKAVIEAALFAEYPQDLDISDCYIEADITADNEQLNRALEMVNTWVLTEIDYDWNGTEIVLDCNTINKWISFETSGNGVVTPVLDEEAISAFVKENAKTYDTYGKKRKFTTTLNVELTLPSGAYGWKTDVGAETEAIISAIKNGDKISREPEYSFRGAQKGSDDIGSSYVEIDLSNQHLYLYKDGNIVLETDFVSGDMSNGNTTPPGVFGITYKTKNAILRGADYETPVFYWMPFNGNVGMHDATWRDSFGGDIYLTSGSHGCVNLPLDKAEEIYEYMSTGFPVICYYY